MTDAPYVTRTGRRLGETEIEQWTREAERGYDVAALKGAGYPGVYRWDVGQLFTLLRGGFGLQEQAALYAEGVREMQVGNFSYSYYVGAPSAVTAQAMAQARLFDLLRPYKVEAFVFDVRVVCLGVPT